MDDYGSYVPNEATVQLKPGKKVSFLKGLEPMTSVIWCSALQTDLSSLLVTMLDRNISMDGIGYKSKYMKYHVSDLSYNYKHYVKMF